MFFQLAARCFDVFLRFAGKCLSEKQSGQTERLGGAGECGVYG